MCRNIKKLYNYEPPATADEVRATAIQFVRKVSGFNKPSSANADAFENAIDDITRSVETLLNSLTTTATPRNRQVEAEKVRQRNAIRFAGKA